MRKFVIQSVKGSTSIVEVEYEVMPKYYNYALTEGQWMGKISAPTFLYEKDVNNKPVPPVWCWWAFHDSVEACTEYLKTNFRESIVRAREKQARLSGVGSYELLTEAELDEKVAEALSQVRVIKLQAV